MRLFSFFLAASLACSYAVAAQKEEKAQKKSKGSEPVFINTRSAAEPDTPEVRELENLLSGTKRTNVLRIMVELNDRLAKEKDIPAFDYGFYITRLNNFLKDKYLELNTQLDRKWFAKMDTLLKAMRDNKNWRASNQVNGKNVHPKYPAKMAQFNGMKKKLKAWTDKPDEPSAAVIKAQQKAKKARIKELQKIIAKQKEDAKRKAKGPAQR